MDIIGRESNVMVQVYRRNPVVIVRGEGARLYDMDGKEYIDFVAGIAVNSVGHSHPGIVKAICDQAKKLMHISNLYYTIPQVELAEKLKEISGMDRFFFCNSGTEAVEAALKFARKHTRKKKFIAFTGSFHGRSMGSLSVTWPEKYRAPFSPLIHDVEFIRFNDVEEFKEKISRDVAGVILELVQGESGVHPAEKEFVRTILDLREDMNYLFIVDEVQTGFGRTGKWFAKDHYGVEPDIMTMAKAMGGGFPVGAAGLTENVSKNIEPGDHASTFGGNPLACASALASISAIEDENLIQRSDKLGKVMRKSLKRIGGGNVRGYGLMVGVDFESAPHIVRTCLDLGLLVNNTSERTLRIVPPLVISEDEISQGVDILNRANEKVQEMQ